MKRKKTPVLVTIMILSVVTIVFWIVFGVINLLKTPTDIKVPPEILSPITPTLDIETLRGLENKSFFTDSQIGEGNISNIDLIPTQEPEVEIEENSNPESTESGGLSKWWKKIYHLSSGFYLL